MRRSILASILLCLLLANSGYSQQSIDYATLETIERDAVTLLLKEDLGQIVEQLQQEQPTTLAPLLRQLIIYSRAARPDGVLKTLQQLKTASDWQAANQPYYVLGKIKQSIGDDLAAWRYYYEELCPRDTDGAEAFVRLWDKKGDEKELDVWLAARSNGDDEWFRQRLYRRARLGTAAELIEPIKAAVRANPRDLELIKRYLRANNAANNLQDISWISEVCNPSGAYENYELGQLLSQASPGAALKFFEKSLSLPFTPRDAELFTFGLRVQVVPLKLNAEKQLRFWTKQLLAEAYQATKRAREAQPLIEELTAMKDDDIPYRDVHQLAGTVQAQTGQRVVERKILVDEATQQKSIKYWMERARYYEGRSDYELERDTYLKALTAVPFDPNGRQSRADRLELVRWLAFFYKRNDSQPAAWSELAEQLRREFNRTPPESDYAFNIALMISDDDYELDELRHKLFVSQPALMARILNARSEWGNYEGGFIEGVVRGDEISPAQENAIWDELKKLVTEPGSLRAYYLAEAMIYRGAWERATPLLLGYLKSDAKHEYVNRAAVMRDLIQAYCAQGKWHEAEEFLMANSSSAWQNLSYDLGAIASSAAQHGATADAIRLWRMKVNLDRRDLSGLDQLARTEARAGLREFYLQMKKENPQSPVAELALNTLR